MNNRIKEIRKDHNMSMRAFADVLGLSSGAISQFEHGNNGVSKRTLNSICREFRVNPDWLINGVGPKYIDETDNFIAAAWFVRELAEDGDSSFKTRFLNALSRLSPSQWGMVEQFMLDVINAKSAPDEPERGSEAAQNDTSSTTI